MTNVDPIDPIEQIDKDLNGKWITELIRFELENKKTAILQGRARGIKLVAYRQSRIGSHQWAIIDTLTGEKVEVPYVVDHPNLGTVQSWRCNFNTKREAVNAASVTNYHESEG